LGYIHEISGVAVHLASFGNFISRSDAGRWLNAALAGIDRRRMPPRWTAKPLRARGLRPSGDALLFCDTFTNSYHPEVGEAAVKVAASCGRKLGLAANACCGRPLISQGLLEAARRRARHNAEALHGGDQPIVFCEPSCLSAVKEDAPDLLRGPAREKAKRVAARSVSWEEYAERELGARLELREGPKQILLHGHCHQKSMGLLAPAKALLARLPGAVVVDLDAGCCGMAGSFGYTHFEVSKAIAERKLLPAARNMAQDAVLVAAGTSCRHQVEELAGKKALHPAELLAGLVAR
jgi:Fe-S oxidoreductase